MINNKHRRKKKGKKKEGARANEMCHYPQQRRQGLKLPRPLTESSFVA